MTPEVESKLADLARIHPELEVRRKPLPDAENGHRQLYELARSLPDEGSPHGEELTYREETWDAARAKGTLASQADLLARVERIAALPGRSSAGMPEDFSGFIPPKAVVRCTQLLLLKARLAAEAGDETEAVRCVAGVMNLAAHLSDVEEPTLTDETASILIERMVCETTEVYLLPALAGKADFARWRKAIAPQKPRTPGRYADVLRGEWYAIARYRLLPVMLDDHRKDRPRDRKAIVKVFAEQGAACIARARGQSLKGLLEGAAPAASTFQGFSRQGREAMMMFFSSENLSAAGYVRQAVVQQQYQAALDLMILERSGRTLSADSMKEVPPNPLDGLPFAFDPATRVLSSPPLWEGDEGLQIKLPGGMP
jgi:hypothetical protein